MDAIYTPPELAAFLAATATLPSPRTIADFAAGDGALLRAAAARWPGVACFGSDIDEEAVRVLRGMPGCQAALHDFLAEDGNGPLEGRFFDLILLNPPFSCRGNSPYSAAVAGATYRASKALVFVARALRFLKRGGELVAILPASVLTSERDADLLDAIRTQAIVEQIGDVHKTAFRSHAVAVAVLRVVRRKPMAAVPDEKPRQVSLRPFAVEMTRGSLSVHDRVPVETGPRFIHTTDLRAGRLAAVSQRASGTRSKVQGPAVLLPRVGRPSKDKIALLPAGDAVLSDCIIAMRTVPAGHERALASLIRKNWAQFSTAYGGSCAPYTSLKKVREALLRLGLLSSVPGVERGEARSPAPGGQPVSAASTSIPDKVSSG